MHLPSSFTHRVPMLGRVAAVVALTLLIMCGATSAQAQSWVSTATQAYPVQYLTKATYLGSLPASTSMHIVVGLQEQNAKQVQTTLRQMLTPGSPLYGTSLTVQQFVQQFGATTAQVQAVEDYLSSYGFKNITVADNQLLIEANGTAADAEAAFNTSLARYSVNGTTLYVNTVAAQVPESLSGTVIAVLGLNNVVSMHTDLTHLSTGPMTVPCTPPECPTPDPSNESYGPQDYQVAYHAALPAAIPSSAKAVSNVGPSPAWKTTSSCNSFAAPQLLSTGDCTAVGIISEGDLTQVVDDLRTYETSYGLPQVPVTVVNAGIASPDTSGADEWDLDSQTSTGIAQQVKHLYFYAATSMTDSDLGLAINKAVSSNQVKAFNMSFGECEFSAYIDGSMLLDDEMFGEAALQGITPFASADDQGSACPLVGTNGVPLSGPPDTAYPASSPYVIAVGGTNLFTNADFTYDFEVAWEASGGGISVFETSPFWQAYTGSGTEPIVLSTEDGNRGVPDVSMCAGGTELSICAANIIVDGTATLVGGTSLSSPLAMGSWARIESSHSNKLGFAGPLIYQLANGASTAPAAPSSPYFNDVIVGSNGLFTALPGYDYVTGLGSWDILVVNQKIPTTYPQ
jgi:pseudomonalisin